MGCGQSNVKKGGATIKHAFQLCDIVHLQLAVE